MTNATNPSPDVNSISLRAWLGWAFLALASFHAAQILGIGWLLIPCAYALIELSRAATNRKVFYPMLGLGMLFYAPHLGFFWNIFGAAAIALWLVLAFWLALFGLTLWLVRLRFGNGWMLALAPFIWTGLEYFRCELYYLRFGWLTFGMGNFLQPDAANRLGHFAFGFVLIALASLLQATDRKTPITRIAALGFATALGAVLIYARLPLAVALLGSGLCTYVFCMSRRLSVQAIVTTVPMLIATGLALSQVNRDHFPHSAPESIRVVGIQLEAQTDNVILEHLNKARDRFPLAELFMLSEYTFQSPPPQEVRDWCASNHVYLVVGGKEPLGETNFYNMAYVIGTNGAIVHQQAKSVPIQFFKDGLPAPERKVWDSPWGKLGVLICYDLSYTRIVDDFVRQGAIALLNPTMDVAEWGAGQHELHARVVRMRAAEYGIPIFRVASSGISQLVSRTGQVEASAAFPGEGAILGGKLPLNAKPRLPLDRWLAPACVGITALALIASLVPTRKKKSPPS
ncbi:MAG: hypothetical protein RLY20_1834 [Verrucomicrobiota bacterium]